MIKKIFILGSASLLSLSLAACSDTSAKETGASEKTDKTTSAQTESAENNENEEPEMDEQKEMAIDTLKEIVKDAESGIVYRFSTGFKIGESTRKEVYAAISEPEETLGEFDFYHGSMGQASYQIAYDKNNVMKEARYFGTNVERQTNLGGITREDLLEYIGEPASEREIPDTGETNIVYFVGDYELQFILAKDGTTDHVNLLEK